MTEAIGELREIAVNHIRRRFATLNAYNAGEYGFAAVGLMPIDYSFNLAFVGIVIGGFIRSYGTIVTFVYGIRHIDYFELRHTS